jgi:hypothetical protein
MEFSLKKITKEQSQDTGMAIVLLFLLLFAKYKREWILIAAMLIHVVNMTAPKIYKPFAVLWLGFSDLMGQVMSKVLLSVLFFLVLTPIGVLRRLSGKDSLRLKAFKAGPESAATERNHVFSAQDLTRPY